MKHYQMAFTVLLMSVLACSFSNTSQESLPTYIAEVDSPAPEWATPSTTLTRTPTSAATITNTPAFTPPATLTPTQLAPEFINAPVPDGAIARISRGYIHDAIVSPDGQYLALDTSTGLYLHEIDTFEEIWNQPTPDNITSFTFSPDGSHLVFGTDTGKVIYLDTVAGIASIEIQVSDIEIRSLSWSPDGNLVVATTKDKAYALSDTGQVIKDVDIPGGSELAWVADSRQRWSPDSSQLYLMDSQTINLISFEEEIKLTDTINVDVGEPYAVLPSTDGLQLFANGTMYRWDGQAFHQEFVVTYDPLPGGVRSISWSPDGKYVAISGSFSDYLVVFDVEKGEEIQRQRSGLIYSHFLFFGADSKTLFYGTLSGILEWQVGSGKLLRRLEGYTHAESDFSTAPNCLSWSPDGATLLIGYGSFEFIQLDALTFERIHRVPLIGWPYKFTWSDDGTLLYVGQFHPHIGASGTIWNAETFEQVQSVPGDSYVGYIFQWSPGGELFVTQEGNPDEYSYGIYESKDLNRLWALPAAHSFRFSPDGNLLGVILDNRLTIYNARTGVYVQSIAFEIEGAENMSSILAEEPIVIGVRGLYGISMSWAPDREHIAVDYRDFNGIIIYDLNTGTRSLILESGTDPVVYSPGGDAIAVGSDQGSVYLYDAASGGLLRTLHGHTYPISALAWKPDATQLASGSQDGTVVIWDMAP